ncbi:hypothetical protein OH738_00695 [Streptomyces hirsutus]|uniref:hypothetical protein n=1 Tax=Streptomyces hirsutus TaxID=35620 RepID=UPI003864E2BA|nr:hypothetical protein OH738_00695 [Streptomyces hirsutus]
MSHTFGRRVATAAASVAVAAGAVLAAGGTASAAGLLATGGSASAATYPSSSQSGVVSAVRTADHHNGDRHSAFGSRGSDGRGHWKRDHDGGRHWIRYDDRDGYQARIDEGRRQWVLDQLRWAEDHGHAHQGSLQHHDRSHS